MIDQQKRAAALKAKSPWRNAVACANRQRALENAKKSGYKEKLK